MKKEYVIARSTNEEQIIEKCEEMKNTYKNRTFMWRRGDRIIMNDGRIGYIYNLIEVK